MRLPLALGFAALLSSLIRYKRENYCLKRTLKLALICGEETNGALNGAIYFATEKRYLIDAAFGVNEGGGGSLDGSGKPIFLGIQIGDNLLQNYTLEVTNFGRHSSRPVPDNAIYHPSRAVAGSRRCAFR